jgi:hypothetical protein
VDRRQAFGVLLGGLAAAVLPAAEPEPLRAVHRWQGGQWVRVRMYELRTGDVFWLEEVGVCRAYHAPRRNPETGQWGVDVDTEIDPSTNEWVPCQGKRRG